MWRSLGIAVFAALALAGGPLAAAAPVIGRPAPALVATLLDGRHFDLAQERGKVTIVNFWATWCGPCRAEMPALDAFHRAFKSRGLVLVGISVDRSADSDRVKSVLARFGYPGAMLDQVSANGFGVPAVIPLTYVIGRDGVLRAILRPDVTPVTAESLARTVLPLLRAPSRAPATPPGSSVNAAWAGIKLPLLVSMMGTK